jgi:hypothetical protein
LKALEPIEVMPSESSTLDKLEHPSKAFAPIDCSDEGKVMLLSELHPLKA